MTNQNEAIEAEVRAIRAVHDDADGVNRSHRKRAALDRHYRSLLGLLAPRFRFFVRRYGLADMQDDAMQACAIAAYRAVEEYDGGKSAFSTFVTWKIRGELQSLRHRMRLDQRGSAQRVSAQTVSMDAMIDGGANGGGGEAVTLVDERALDLAEASASARMARNLTGLLLDDYAAMSREKNARSKRPLPPKPGTIGPEQVDALEAKLARERQIVSAHLLGGPDLGEDGAMTSEQKRQVTRRVLRHVSRRVREKPRFAAALSTMH